MLQNLFYDYIILERGLSKNTLSSYKRDIEDFFDFFGTFVVSEDQVRDYLLSMECSTRSLVRKISSLKSLYRFLLSNNYVEFSPMENIKGIKMDQKIPSYLSGEEIKAIAQTFTGDYKGVRDRMIFDILVYTGSRISEVVNLKLHDVDLENRTLRILGKGDKVRIVPIQEGVADSLASYIKDFRELFTKGRTELLFPNISRNLYWSRLKKYALKAGVDKKIYPHIFRHSFATIMLNNGANIRHVQEILGHSSVSTTEIYTHISKDRLKKVYNEIKFGEKI